jgi:thiamine-monophosphate kinase
LTRNTLKPGEDLWVQGGLGLSHWGLRLLEENKKNSWGDLELKAIQEHKNPSVKFGLGPFLAEKSPCFAAMDMSDGLGQSLFHLAEASGVKIVVNENALPISADLLGGSIALSLQEEQSAALWGGEEYKLLFSLPKGVVLAAQEIKKWKLSKIGFVENGEGCVLKQVNKDQIALNLEGFSHF